MSEKQTGYSLVGLGMFIMICAFVYILLVFTGIREPVAVLSIPAPKIDLSSMIAGSLPDVGIVLPKNEIEIMPTEGFNKMLNMTISLLLAGFVMSFGFKLASLGIMFVRPIKVNLKSEPPPQAPLQ